MPYKLYIPSGLDLKPLILEEDVYQITILPLYQCSVDYSKLGLESIEPILNITKNLAPEKSPKITNNVLVNGEKTISVNVLQINFHKDNFKRKKVKEVKKKPDCDPSLDVLFNYANMFLRMLRTITKGDYIKPVSYDMCIWRIDYLDDEGKVLQEEPNKIRVILSSRFSWKVAALNELVWESLTKIPVNYEPPRWESLLLDATCILPEIGPAIVLSFTAIETIISSACDILAKKEDKTNKLWKWLNSRDVYWKQPSIKDKLDSIFKILANVSLKADRRDLWDDFIKLHKARNNYVHKGKVRINGQELNVEETKTLIHRAREIVTWIENLIKDEITLYKLETPVKINVVKQLM